MTDQVAIYNGIVYRVGTAVTLPLGYFLYNHTTGFAVYSNTQLQAGGIYTLESEDSTVRKYNQITESPIKMRFESENEEDVPTLARSLSSLNLFRKKSFDSILALSDEMMAKSRKGSVANLDEGAYKSSTLGRSRKCSDSIERSRRGSVELLNRNDKRKGSGFRKSTDYSAQCTYSGSLKVKLNPESAFENYFFYLSGNTLQIFESS